jgi:hypothetical protein
MSLDQLDFSSVLEHHKNLIQNCHFDKKNPFDVEVDIINYNLLMPQFLHKKLTADSYRAWMQFTFEGEANAGNAYTMLLDRIKNKNYSYFNNLDSNQLNTIYDFLEQTITEEIQHAQLINHLCERIGYNFSDIPFKWSMDLDKQLNEENLLQTLFEFYIGEVQVLIGLALIFKYSKNIEKKNYLKIVAQEESKHVTGFLKIVQAISKNIDKTELDRIDDSFRNNSYFFYEYMLDFDLHEFFIYCNKNLDKSDPQKQDIVEKFLDSIIESNFQKEYLSSINKRIYQYYQSLFPHITENEYNEIVQNKLNRFFENIRESDLVENRQ